MAKKLVEETALTTIVSDAGHSQCTSTAQI